MLSKTVETCVFPFHNFDALLTICHVPACIWVMRLFTIQNSYVFAQNSCTARLLCSTSYRSCLKSRLEMTLYSQLPGWLPGRRLLNFRPTEHTPLSVLRFSVSPGPSRHFPYLALCSFWRPTAVCCILSESISSRMNFRVSLATLTREYYTQFCPKSFLNFQRLT